jgi:hypothetical protein
MVERTVVRGSDFLPTHVTKVLYLDWSKEGIHLLHNGENCGQRFGFLAHPCYISTVP